jgi:hypothetical protein
MAMKRHPQAGLAAGERIVVPPRKAIHTDRGRKAGGKLFITDRRLIFNPNFLDSWLFASVALELSDISGRGCRLAQLQRLRRRVSSASRRPFT